MSTSIEIDAPLQRVWDLATDVERLGEWVSIHRGFPSPPPAKVEQGTSFQQTLAVAGTPFTVEWTAVEVDGPRRLSWEATGPAGATARTTYLLAAAGGGTHFGYQNEFELPVGELGEAAGAVMSGHAKREADGSLARLKQLAEG